MKFSSTQWTLDPISSTTSNSRMRPGNYSEDYIKNYQRNTPLCFNRGPASKQIKNTSDSFWKTPISVLSISIFQIKDDMQVHPNALLFLTTEGRMEGRQKAYRLRQIMAAFSHPRLKRPWQTVARSLYLTTYGYSENFRSLEFKR